MNTTMNSDGMNGGRSSRTFAGGLIRPAWTPVTIAMMIIGFMIFWPLGLAMIAYILWGDRLETFKQDFNRSTERYGFWRSDRHGFHGRTGNVAFDDWRAAEIERLEEERRKLDEMRREFDEHLRELRRARDQEEFDAFMAARQEKPKSRGGRPKSVPEV